MRVYRGQFTVSLTNAAALSPPDSASGLSGARFFRIRFIRRFTRRHLRSTRSYMLNTRNEETNTVFYSYLACFVNTLTLNT